MRCLTRVPLGRPLLRLHLLRLCPWLLLLSLRLRLCLRLCMLLLLRNLRLRLCLHLCVLLLLLSLLRRRLGQAVEGSLLSCAPGWCSAARSQLLQGGQLRSRLFNGRSLLEPPAALLSRQLNGLRWRACCCLLGPWWGPPQQGQLCSNRCLGFCIRQSRLGGWRRRSLHRLLGRHRCCRQLPGWSRLCLLVCRLIQCSLHLIHRLLHGRRQRRQRLRQDALQAALAWHHSPAVDCAIPLHTQPTLALCVQVLQPCRGNELFRCEQSWRRPSPRHACACTAHMHGTDALNAQTHNPCRTLTSAAWRQTLMKRMPRTACADQLSPDMIRMVVARLLTGTGRQPSFSSWETARIKSASVLRHMEPATGYEVERAAMCRDAMPWPQRPG